jgi:hypothetical protein
VGWTMSECLTDMQIALLAAGKASPALRSTLSEHLLVCDECRRLVAACVKAERVDSPSVGEEMDIGAISMGHDLPWISRVVEAVASAKQSTTTTGAIRRIISLEWLTWDTAGSPVLAAAPQTDRIAGLPTLASADRQVLVHFRCPDPGGPIVAHVLRKGEHDEGAISLVLPERGLSFPVGAQGTAELTGVTAEELVGVRVQLEMTPLEPGEGLRESTEK